MIFRKFTFKEKDYVYDEESYYSICKAFDSQAEEYKSLPSELKEKYLEDKALEVCKASMTGNVFTKLKKESENTKYLFDARYSWTSAEIAMENFPLELYPNIVEWVNDEEISYIDYHGLSMKELLGYVNFPEEDKWLFEKSLYKPNKARCFVEAMILMSEYVENGCEEPIAYLIQAGFTYRKPDAYCH